LCSVLSSGAQVIIDEFLDPGTKKTIPPVDVGGVAGGLKYLSHNIFFKFGTFSKSLELSLLLVLTVGLPSRPQRSTKMGSSAAMSGR